MIAQVLLLVAIPVAAALVTSLLGVRAREWAGLAVAAVLAGVVLAQANQAVTTDTIATARLPLPIGVEVGLIADGLALVMLVMTALVGFGVAAFAWAEDRGDPGRHHRAFWPLVFSLWAATNLLLLAGDLFTAYLMLEVVALCGSLLVTLRGDRGSALAGTRYFYAELVASTTMLLGIALVWSQAGTVVFAELGPALDGEPLGRVGLAVMTIGLLLKAPLAPLHFWLPAAHTLAPSAVSPLLSGVMVKVAFAVLVRLWFLAVPDLVTEAAAQLIGAMGLLAILWGSAGALLATGLKRLIASSTVAQLGLLFLMVPVLAAGAVQGWTGGLVLAVSHALAKAAMLMAATVMVDSARRAGVPAPEAGSVAEVADAAVGPAARAEGSAHGAAPAASAVPVTVRGETTWPLLHELRGSAVRRPVAMMAFGIAGLSLVGLPPSGGFVAKWYLLEGSVRTGQWWWVAALVVGTLLTVGYLMRFVRPAFAPLPDSERPVPRRDARDLVALVLATSTLLLGLVPGPLVALAGLGGPSGG